LGTWSPLPFGNDDAADWAYALEDTDALEPIDEAIAVVLARGADSLESFEAAEAIAAIELLTCVVGRPGDTETYTEAADAWLKRVTLRPGPELLQQSLRVIDRVLAEASELHEVWRKSDEYDDWLAAMADLRARVSASIA
jgi:hypothetical protein